MNPFKYIVPLFSIAFVFTSGCKDDDPKPFKQNVALHISHEWNDSLLVLNKSYFWSHDSKIDTITPTTLIYHINNLTLYTQDSLRIDANLPYYMIDYDAKSVLPSDISFTTPKEGVKYYVTSLEFTIGVADSLTSLTGALNSTFVSPMYWGMIQGYINFKLDALSPQTNTGTLFYHIGGYRKPYYNSRRVKVIFDKPYYLNKENTLTISANIDKLFNSAHKLDITNVNQVEVPNDDSKLIADNMAKMFSFKSLK